MVLRTSAVTLLTTLLVVGIAVADGKPKRPHSITNSIGMDLVLIPAGELMMGSPESEKGRDSDERQHRVTLSQPFYLGKYEVTQGEWKRVMGTEPWKGKSHVQNNSRVAATFVSWVDAKKFCEKLTDLNRTAGKLSLQDRYDLPTEAQWEYACRAGSKTAYSFGDDSSRLSEYGWWGGFTNNGDGNAVHEQYAHAVGLKLPNAFGLYDMHGNVWELCRDWYGEYPASAAKDPSGPDTGSDYVCRGGCWVDVPRYQRSADRSWMVPSGKGYGSGFRVALIVIDTNRQPPMETPILRPQIP